MIFFLAKYHLSLSPNQIAPHDPISFNGSIPGAMFGMILIMFTITLFLEWFYYQRGNRLLLFSIITIILSFSYIVLIWFVLGSNLPYGGGVHRYFVIPSITNSISLALFGLLLIKSSQKPKTKLITSIVLLLFFYFLSVSSLKEINHHFNSIKNTGNNLEAQNIMRNEVLKLLPANKKNMLIYIEFKERNTIESYWNKAFDPNYFHVWYKIYRSHLIPEESVDGCITVTYKKNELDKNATIVYNQKGFTWNSNCGITFFPIEDFFALKLEPQRVTNITPHLLENIIFKKN